MNILRYIGETKRSVAKRLSEHRGCITCLYTKVFGLDFNFKTQTMKNNKRKGKYTKSTNLIFTTKELTALEGFI